MLSHRPLALEVVVHHPSREPFNPKRNKSVSVIGVPAEHIRPDARGTSITLSQVHSTTVAMQVGDTFRCTK